MAFTQDYDQINYDPAAPVVEISITNPHIPGLSQNLVALVDSGADGTMLPITALESIKAKFLETRRMRGITGHAIKVDSYLITIQIGPFSIFGIEAIALEQDSEAIIGRETINQLKVTLDGLSQTLTVSQ